MRAGVPATLAYMFPRANIGRASEPTIRERLNGEIKRRTRVVGVFRDRELALVLVVAAQLRPTTRRKWGTRQYRNMDKLRAVEAESGPPGGARK